ncbi:hypothetical protein D3C72_2193880 [compost metagenome]
MHDGVKVLQRGWRERIGATDDTRHIPGDFDLLAVELPGQPADAGGVGHVHGQHLGAQGLYPLAARIVAHGGNHAATRLGVLAHQLQPNAARCADDKYGFHG